MADDLKAWMRKQCIYDNDLYEILSAQGVVDLYDFKDYTQQQWDELWRRGCIERAKGLKDQKSKSRYEKKMKKLEKYWRKQSGIKVGSIKAHKKKKKKSNKKKAIINEEPKEQKSEEKSDDSSDEKDEKDEKNEKKKDPKIELKLDTELGQLLKTLPMEGIIEYEEANRFWLIKLSKEWQDIRATLAQLTDKIYCKEAWYSAGFERGNQYAAMVKEKDVNIMTMPPTSIAGAHITLGRFDIKADDKPQCFVKDEKVKFKVKRLVCFPPFWSKPKNLPGQAIDDKGYRYYATHWMSLEIEFIDFDYKTRFPPHVSLCNIAVKLKVDDVQKLNEIQI